ncbi:MAG: DUF3857 domain-containing protein, partial [Prevotellaceae bacterium]|nr:DUF3857 domain-containing protein [Prevotellaceae bacterium]
ILIYDYKIKIKILTKEGASWADGEIFLYENGNSKQTLSDFEASAYNLVDGRIKKTIMEQNYISREKINEKRTAVKFSIPEVRSGTVIEYKYRIKSDFIFAIPDVNMQHSIPVMYSKFIITAPEYFSFNYFNAGYSNINIQRKRGVGYKNVNTSGYRSSTFYTNIVWCEMEDLPALKREPYIWCLDDFRIKVEFEVSAASLPNGFLEKFTNTWKDVSNKLRYMSFNTDLKTSYPFKKEVVEIKNSKLSEIEKVRAILKLVKSKISWNGRYRLISDKLNDAIKKGEGTSAEINFVLHSALRDAGFDVVPVLLNPRSYGRIPNTLPTIDKINTFIIKVNLKNSQIFVDGTNLHTDINILPVNLLVDRARIYKVNDDTGWIDLTNIVKSTYSSVLIGNIDETGILSGTIKKTYTNQSAYSFKNKYAKYNSKEEYIKDFEKENNLQISNIEIQGLDSSAVVEIINFKGAVNSTADYIYLNSLVLPFMSENPFNQQGRILPIEFEFPVTYDIMCNIKYPENYIIEEMPKNIKYTLNDNEMNCQYITQNVGNNIQMKFNFTMDKIIYPASKYNELKSFYGMLTQMSGSQIVIKKNQ